MSLSIANNNNLDSTQEIVDQIVTSYSNNSNKTSKLINTIVGQQFETIENQDEFVHELGKISNALLQTNTPIEVMRCFDCCVARQFGRRGMGDSASSYISKLYEKEHRYRTGMIALNAFAEKGHVDEANQFINDCSEDNLSLDRVFENLINIGKFNIAKEFVNTFDESDRRIEGYEMIYKASQDQEVLTALCMALVTSDRICEAKEKAEQITLIENKALVEFYMGQVEKGD